ncbi:MAG: hypothetical protein IPP07_00570 [Holophagales bacterium]|nr:hypothetical protein [Holophagales bacterium]
MAWRNGSRIVSLPGDPATVRTYSPDLVLLDEAAYIKDELPTALLPMLQVTRGRLIVLSSPGEEAGWLYRVWSEAGPEWERHHVSALTNPRIDQARLEAERSLLGEVRFRREYLAEFGDEIDTRNPKLVGADVIQRLREQIDANDDPGPRAE